MLPVRLDARVMHTAAWVHASPAAADAFKPREASCHSISTISTGLTCCFAELCCAADQVCELAAHQHAAGLLRAGADKAAARVIGEKVLGAWRDKIQHKARDMTQHGAARTSLACMTWVTVSPIMTRVKCTRPAGKNE